jgi:predicted SnoaL-like aldol condensation-catalyzing enzyme
MNDQGLFFDYFSVPKLKIKQSREKPRFPGPFTDSMMAKCATVGDVLEMLSNYYLEWNPKIQMFVVDKTGDSAIIEGETVVRKRDNYQVVTNFRISRIPEDQRPCEAAAWSCSRYKKVERMLLDSNAPTVPHFRTILQATHRSSYNLIGTTQYSNIYDLTNKLVYVYYFHDFDNEIVLSLSEELKKGRHYFDLPSLFGKELKYDIRVYTHSSPDFSISYPKHYKVIKPILNEVLLVKNPLSSTPQLGVYVENKPNDIHLEDIGQEYFYSIIEKYSTSVKLVSSNQTLLNDGTSAVEIFFDRMVNEFWPLKTLILSTYRGDKLIFAAITSVEHPEALRDYIYDLRFD